MFRRSCLLSGILLLVPVLCITKAEAQVRAGQGATDVNITQYLGAAFAPTNPLPVAVQNNTLTSFIAVKCINATASAFESCAGAGGGGGSVPTDTDDGFITSDQLAGLNIGLLHLWNSDTAQWDRVPGDGTNGILAHITIIPPVDINTLPALAAGTNNIGDVDVLTLPSIPAGANAIGSITNTAFGITGAIPAGTNNIGDVDVLTLPSVVVSQTGTANDFNLVDAGGTALGTAGNPVKVSTADLTTVIVSQTGTNNDVDVLTLPALSAGTNNIGKVDVNSLLHGFTAVTTATGMGAAACATISTGLEGYASVAWQWTSVGAATTVNYQQTTDGGTTWASLDTVQAITGITAIATQSITGAPTFWVSPIHAGVNGVRVCIVATGGTSAVRVIASTDSTVVSVAAPSAVTGGWFTRTSLNYLNANAIEVNVGAPGFGTLRTASVIHDGTNTMAVKAASTAAVATDPSAVVALSPNSNTIKFSQTTTDNDVDVATLPANASVNLNQVAGTAIVNGGLAGSQSVGGTAGNNAAITQNPLVIGLEARSTAPTQATSGNQIRSAGDLAGNQFTVYPLSWTCNLQALAATLTQCQAAPNAAYSLYVTQVVATTTTTTAGTFAIRYGTGANCATTPIGVWPQPGGAAPSRVTTAPLSTAAPMGISFGPIGFKVAAANAICVIGTATNTIDITISGYIAP